MSDRRETKEKRRDFIWRVLMGLSLAGAFVVAAFAIDILLLVFGGVLLAVFLRALSDPIAQHTRLSELTALTLVIFVIGALFGLGGLAVAPEFVAQAQEVQQAVPGMMEQIQELLQRFGLDGQLMEDGMGAGQMGGQILQGIVTVAGGIAGLTAYFLTFLFVGLFVAYNPDLYRDGVVNLTPSDYRPTVDHLFGKLGPTIRWWLIGRAIAMVAVGVSTFVLLTVLGVPLALLVAMMTTIFTFIPYLGPVLGMIPVTLAGLLEDPTVALYALGIYFIIENIEGYALDPIIQRKMVYLPPALTVAVQIGMGLLIGPLGIALATPLAAVGLVVVQETYLKRPDH